MENIRNTFEEDCKIINLKYEYPGYIGEAKFGVITALSEDELEQRYSDQLGEYRPYIVLSPAFGEIRAEFVKNEWKNDKRQLRHDSCFGFDENTELHHQEIVVQDPLYELILSEERAERNSKLREGLLLLSETQRRRIIQYFVLSKNLMEIAAQEGKSLSTIHESICSALKKLKKFYETPEKNTSPSPNK